MLMIQTILSFLLLWLQSGEFMLKQDLMKDAKILSGSSVFISDNTHVSPTIKHIAHDLQLFGLAASIDLGKATHTSENRQGTAIQHWALPEGNIRDLYQVDLSIVTDTIVDQHYLVKPSTQQRLSIDSSFRAYILVAENGPVLYYLTELDQGLLQYRIGEREVQLNYPNKKEGLSDVMPMVEAEMDQLLKEFTKSTYK